MELSDDLVAIQGILISLIKATGELTKINYKGGNEEKILRVIEEIQKYLLSKNYVKNAKINTVFDKQVEDIVLFLAVNTKYKKSLELNEYDHLINIMPQLSKCVLANVVYSLDLCKYYCKVIEILPLKHGIELLEEMIPCLKKSHPEIQLRYCFMFLKSAAIKLSSELSEKDEDDVYQVCEVTSIILQFLTGIYPGHAKNLKTRQIYQHMGFTLLSLFELLLYCNKDNVNLEKFIDNVLKTCCTIIKNVTINVFCSWAEIKEGDEPLQSVVGCKAYEIVEGYGKYKDAKELISMLGTIAVKPKTLRERIQAADIATIIRKVNGKDLDQKAWFKALLSTHVFENEDTLSCINTWCHLCDDSDVTRLLNLSIQANKEGAKQVAVRCASTLSLDLLIVVMTRYFYENKFTDLVSDSANIQSQMGLFLRKFHCESVVDDDFVKEICLLLLQSPSCVMGHVYSECVRNKFYTVCFKKVFVALKEISSINSFGVTTLWQAILLNQLEIGNIDSYVSLFVTLLGLEYLSSTQLINKILLPLLEKYRQENDFQRLGFVLQIFLGCTIVIPPTSEMTDIRWALLHTMNECRCTFLTMDTTKQQTAGYAVEVVTNLCEVSPNYNFEGEFRASPNEVDSSDEFTNYYKKYLSCKADATLLQMFCGNFNGENQAQCICQLLKLIPRAVTSEWINVLKEILFRYDSQWGIKLFTECLIMLSKLVISQNGNTETGAGMMAALKYCLQQYGLSLKNVHANSSLQIELDISRSICRLLKYLPEVLKEEEGLSLAVIPTRRSLKVLVEDKEFLCSLASIKNQRVCQTITQTAMGST